MPSASYLTGVGSTQGRRCQCGLGASMKFGGPWKSKGPQPQAREPMRDAARRSGMSVGEWLNTVIQRNEEEHLTDDSRLAQRMRDVSRRHRHDRGGVEARPIRHLGGPYRDEQQGDRDRHRHRRDELRNEREELRDSRDASASERHQQPSDHDHRPDQRSDRDDLSEPAREAVRPDGVQEDARREEGARAAAREAAREEAPREASSARAGLGDIHARLDALTQQLDKLAHVQAARQRAVLAPVGVPPEEKAPQLIGIPPQPTGAPSQPRRMKPEPVLSIDDAVAEIKARQRMLDNPAAEAPLVASLQPVPPASASPIAPAATEPAPAPVPVAAAEAKTVQQSPPPESVTAPAPASTVDFSSLENQLREITARIEALQPASGIEQAIAAIRTDLADIGRQLNEALPRRALESLEIEVRALGQRIDHSRQCGVDPNVLTGIERGLADIREALRALTPAENLIGFNEAVTALSQKVDLILARDDPSALQQLETAIGGLRGVVSHVASNDTLTRVAEEVRALAAQVDAIANHTSVGQAVSVLEQRIGALAGQVDGIAGNTASGPAFSSLEQRIDALAGQVSGMASNTASGNAVSALEQRIDNLTAALTASSEAGHAVPRDLEKMLAGLIEKLEWVQLTHTDHAALAHLEDRIAALVQRFDASDARLDHLEAIERGLADLLVHLEQMRGMMAGAGAAPVSSALLSSAPPAIERQVAEIRQSERRTQDSLEAVHGTVEHVVDRLASIESGLHRDTTTRAEPPAPMPPPRAQPPYEGEAERSTGLPSPLQPTSGAYEISAPRVSPARSPIDPSLPPDHPLEPGSAAGRTRPTASAAERVSASEAAVGSAKPPVISDSERPNFIAAARRAAQAAAWEASGQKGKGAMGALEVPAQSGALSDRMRKLIVAGSAVLIAVGCLRIATKLYEDNRSNGTTPVQSEAVQHSAPAPVAVLPSAPPTALGPPLTLPSAPAPNASAPNAPSPNAPVQTGPAQSASPAPPVHQPATNTLKPGHQSMMREGQAQPVTGAIAQPPQQPVASAMPSWAVPDITGALPGAAAAPNTGPQADRPAAMVTDKLPVTIGDPALRKAALAGDPSAAYEIADRFAEGRGVLRNNEEAAYWLQRAAKAGLAPAEFRLGGLYEKGLGVTKDLGKARDLYLAAAEKGNGKAMHNLAVLYAEGVDGPPDYNKAAVWFTQAAEHGVSDSQYNLGILYARGIGVAQSNAESYKWFALAAKQGDKDAATKRDEIAARLDKQSLAAARLAVQKWSPEPQPSDAINVKTQAAWNSPTKNSHAQSAK
jgi:localization factor PodJL